MSYCSHRNRPKLKLLVRMQLAISTCRRGVFSSVLLMADCRRGKQASRAEMGDVFWSVCVSVGGKGGGGPAAREIKGQALGPTRNTDSPLPEPTAPESIVPPKTIFKLPNQPPTDPKTSSSNRSLLYARS